MSPKTCFCINPNCQQPDFPGNDKSHFCLSCGSPLLLNGKYRVSRLLSDESGFGNVYEVFIGFNARIVKVLKHTWNNNPKAIKLFEQEYNVLDQLSNKQGLTGIPKAEDYFIYQTKENLPLYCLVMEKVEGIDLEQWLKNNKKLKDQEQAIKWLKEILCILEEVHKLNWFHRDIKPGNIMMRNNGELVLIDFGTAREETQTYYQNLQGQNVTGIVSAGYTPIEQQNGQAVTQSDFFALGRTFVHLLTGKHPLDQSIYNGTNDLLIWRRETEFINDQFLDLIDYLMQRLAKDRPQNTQVILQILHTIPLSYNQSKSIGSIEQNPQPNNHFYPPTITSNPPPQKSNFISEKIMVIGAGLLSLFIVVVSGMAIINQNKPNTDQAKTSNTPSPIPQTTTTPQVQNSPIPQTPDPVPRKDPKEAVFNYYQSINQGQYQNAWNQFSTDMQNNQKIHPDGYQSFYDWNSKIAPVTITYLNLIESQENNAMVDVEYYFFIRGKRSKLYLRFFLVYNNDKQDWEFEKVKKI